MNNLMKVVSCSCRQCKADRKSCGGSAARSARRAVKLAILKDRETVTVVSVPIGGGAKTRNNSR